MGGESGQGPEKKGVGGLGSVTGRGMGCGKVKSSAPHWRVSGHLVPPVRQRVHHHTAMNNIPTILRHWFTLAATAFTLWIVSALLLSADDAKAIGDAAGKLIEPLVVIVTLAIAALWRIFLVWIQKLFSRGAGEAGYGSGVGMLLVWVGTMAGLCLGLPSCSPESAAAIRAVPIKVFYITQDGSRVSYSSKAGLEVEVDQHSGK